MLIFEKGGKTEIPEEKTLRARMRAYNKLNPHTYLPTYLPTLFIPESNNIYKLKTKKKSTSRKGSLEVNPILKNSLKNKIKIKIFIIKGNTYDAKSRN